jgi:hypothetical protein
MKSHHFHAFGRFWWLLVIGAGVALIAGVSTVADISAGVPPKVTYRAQPTYSAEQLELVTAKNNPYLRTQQRTVVTRTGQAQRPPARSSTGAVTTTPTPQSVIQLQAPDVDVLVRAANYYPYLIQSDQVVAIRNKRFGPLEGQVTAAALNSFSTASRFRQSTFPIIQVMGTASTPKQAKKIAVATVAAFREWLTKSQNSARVPENERVLIQELQRPEKVIATGGPKHGIDLIVGVLVFALFVGGALVLDKLFPRGRRRGATGGTVEMREANQLELDLQPAAAGVAADDDSADLNTTRWAADGPGV